jgi:thiamine-monophosphate kinase
MLLTNENNFVELLVKNFARSQNQINTLNESDSELIKISDELFLAATTDSICEEIQEGLYDNPYMIGWMTVSVNVSDLAAVGASPLGILLNQTFLHDHTEEFITELQKGINDACNTYSIPVLGGDTNYSSVLQMSATALGIVKNKVMKRKGCMPEEMIYSSAKLGEGNAFAFSKLTKKKQRYNFLPMARIKEGILLREFASCCMDTSDGMFSTLDQLMRVNNLGLCIDQPIENFISKQAASICKENNIPKWFMLAGIHGEYELLFTISKENENEFLSTANSINWFPIKLGKVIPFPEIKIQLYNKMQSVNTGEIRNMFNNPNVDIHYFISELMKIDNNFRRIK